MTRLYRSLLRYACQPLFKPCCQRSILTTRRMVSCPAFVGLTALGCWQLFPTVTQMFNKNLHAESTIHSPMHQLTKELAVHAVILREEKEWKISPWRWLKTGFLRLVFIGRGIFRFLYLAIVFSPALLTLPVYIYYPPFKRQYHLLILRTLEYGGPLYIKLGQWASARPDIFPVDLCQSLGKLHDNVPHHSFKWTQRIIAESLEPGREIEDVFVNIDPEPVGSGCIAQVHRGRIRTSALSFTDDRFKPAQTDEDEGLEVAIKVQHPYSTYQINLDLAIMKFIANVINCLPHMEWLSLPAEVEEFSTLMKSQLDFRIEAANLTRFRQNFINEPNIVFPKPMISFVSEHVLVETYEDGLPVRLFVELQENHGKEEDEVRVKKEIADLGLKAFLNMVLTDNFIHSDLHMGNIFVQLVDRSTQAVYPSQKLVSVQSLDSRSSSPDTIHIDPRTLRQALGQGYEPRLVLLDAGLTTELSPVNFRNFIDLFSAVAEGDGLAVARLMVERARGGYDVNIKRCIDYFGFESKMASIVQRVKKDTFRLAKVKIGDVLGDVLAMVRQHHVKIESDFTNLVVSIMVLEGLGRQLDPDLDLFEVARPLLRFRKSEFYTAHGGLFFKLSAFLEARSWLLHTHDEETYGPIDVLLFNNF